MAARTIRYYEPTLVEIKPGEERVATAAVLSCGLCGNTIDGMGGPGNGAICERCYSLLSRGALRGVITPIGGSKS